MSAAPPMTDTRMATLAEALKTAEVSVNEFRDLMKNVNREDLQVAATLALEAADALFRHHLSRPSPTIADDITVVLGAFKLLNIPAVDAEFGRLPNLAAMRGARGNIREDLGDVLQAADVLGWRPSNPVLPDVGSTEVSRIGIDLALKALVVQMEAVELLLDQVVRPEGERAPQRSLIQLSLVNVFFKDIKLELVLAKVSAQMRDIIDLAALGRAVENVAELTADFVASVRGMATKMTAALRKASDQLRPTVLKITNGFSVVIKEAASVVPQQKRMVDLSSQEHAATLDAPIDFDIDVVHELILNRKPLPSDCRPWISKLDFSFSSLRDLTALENLSALRSLDLRNTQIMDLSPLAGIPTLQLLDLGDMRVTDLTPLARLSDLLSLHLSHTSITNLWPLARLPSLRSLHLLNTQVTDLAPLSRLFTLQSLHLSYTPVAKLVPLARLTALRSLQLRNTQVVDVAPLAGLSALQTLDLSHSLVTDLTPLAELHALQTLDLVSTGVYDLSPLVQLPELKNIYVESEMRQEALAESLGSKAHIVKLYR
jgi:Leucine-rich repeat (LRR) protein